VTGQRWLLIAVLLAAAMAAAWPSDRTRRRLRVHRTGAGRRRLVAPMPTLPAWRDLLAGQPPRRLVAMATAAAGGLGWLAGGPVAGLVGAVYGALGARAAKRAASDRQHAGARARRLDDLSALAADLRAGLPPAGVLGHAHVAGPAAAESVPVAWSGLGDGDRILSLTRAVWRLAERTGAPVADLVERIERDARAEDRARASAAAQAAGAQATALLLAALPLGGIALGYAIGADPLRVLLHTPLGAACAAGAVLLQSGGLLWADRLTNGAAR
jgi:tight adherence protein B